MADLKTVQVALRVRPISQAELARGNDSVVKVVGRQEVIVGDGKLSSERFTFNYTFNPNTTQLELYEQAVVDLLEKLFEGYNVTILAYGQTCSGKTYTMGTEFKGELGDEVGVIPRAVTDIFRVIEAAANEGSASATTKVSCSFIELYQETVYDLLSANRQSLEIREGTGGIVLQGLTKVPVDSVQATLDCLRRGATVRCVGSTAMNEVSSRSHAIFTINITKVSPDDPQSVVRSKFHLVDLAGSERSKKTQATGDRFKEGVQINRGLLALGNVISALGSLATNGSTGSVHVPYRDSKLTRLLQDSLGGNSFTLMIACISPVDYNREETLSTLRYADRACKIKNKPIVNVDPQRAHIIQLEATIAELRQTIAKLRGLEGGEVEKNGLSPEIAGKAASSNGILNDARLLQLEEKNRNLLDRMQTMLQHLATNEMRALTAEKALEDIEAKLDLEQAAEEDGEGGGQDESGSVDQTPRPRTMDYMKSVVGETLVSYRQERNRLELPAANARESIEGDADADAQVSQSESMLQASDSHTQQQLRLHNELNELNSMLAVKEQLVRRFLGQGDAESSVVATRPCQLRAQLEEHESTIRALEAQLAVQNEQLGSTKASDKTSKLAEERRRKVRQLETELAALRQRTAVMQNQLKQKEKDCQRVPGLTAEIKAMKAARVQLLKTMRAEQEKFRQWQQTQQKQICQLEAKDRKRQQAIQKMESMHALQKQVMLRRMDVEKKALQRKMDETAAVNRRLKAALERRKPAAGAGSGSGADRSNLRGAEALQWIDQELELLHSAVEATEMIKLLEQQRDEESEQLAIMKAEAAEEPRAQNGTTGQSVGDLQRERIANFEASLRVRNETIAELEQKLQAVNMDEQLATLSSTLASLPETRDVMRRLLDVLVQKDVAFIRERFTKAEAQCKQQPVASRRTLTLIKHMDPEEQYRQLLQRYKLQQQCHSDRTDDMRGGEDELIALTENVLSDSSTLRDELNLFKASYKLLQAQLDELRANGARGQPVFKKPKLSKVVEYTQDDDLEEDEEEYFLMEESEEDLERDPTFRATPLAKRKKPEPIVPPTNDSSSSSATGTSAQQLNITFAHCNCAGTCSTKRCGCRKNNIACSSTCKCPENCVNQDNQENQSVTQDEERKPKESEPEGDAQAPKRPVDQHLDILEYVRQNKNENHLSTCEPPTAYIMRTVKI
ncbi:AGAP000575-PA-like protein [Anopheles sinensis]|uniref:AGAP000575-PA-like protein n=1 Tax=Anopheles sinensis TaxID=74873 RepID=A0A084VAA7_ANOSI|nr:AGAP000575-PA-like protein [Anopheles sinensis]